MPFGSVTLQPGVNAERTPTLLRAGISQSRFIRFKDSLVQKLGGWQRLYQLTVSGIPRDLHAWEDLNSVAHLGVGTTTQVAVITPSVSTLHATDVSIQVITSDFPPSASTDGVNPWVTITDPTLSASLTTEDSVYFNVPFTIGGIGGMVIDGLHAIVAIPGFQQYAVATPVILPKSNVVYVPQLTTKTGSPDVSIHFPGNGLFAGSTFYFPITAAGPGKADDGTPNDVSFLGGYTVSSVVGSPTNDDFTIRAAKQSTSPSPGATFYMKQDSLGNPLMEAVYYVAVGPPNLGDGYGGPQQPSGYGGTGPDWPSSDSGNSGYGTGIPGRAIVVPGVGAEDWTLDNWGELLVACPLNGGIFFYDPTGGFQNLQIIPTAPAVNTGIFVSMSQEILVAFGSSVHVTGGWEHDPMLVAWSDVGDFTNWTPSAATQAGDFRISIGSKIVGGMAVANQNLIWTDLDLWAMNYIGPPLVFGFNKIGAGAGLTSMHGAQQMRGSVYWMGPVNFYSYTSGGVSVMPCPVWDVVFQNLNVSYLNNVRAMPNTSYNEIGWLYPSAASVDGECDSYVKTNLLEPGMPWDYGPLSRTAWIDHTVLGMPIASTSDGRIFQHEMTNDADGQVLSSSFTTGYFFLSEGEDFVTVDQIYPDFKWNFYSPTTFTGNAVPDAMITLNFLLVNYPGDTPTIYGPFTVTRQTVNGLLQVVPQWIPVRFRGRQMAIQVQSNDIGSFWRLGYVRYRFSVQGRR